MNSSEKVMFFLSKTQEEANLGPNQLQVDFQCWLHDKPRQLKDGQDESLHFL